MNALPLINGQQHSWSSIEVRMLDNIVTGITSVNYDDSVMKENHYGAGDLPVHRGRGKYEAKASITLYNYEVEAIIAALPRGKRLQDVPAFDIVVSYLDDTNDIITHVVRNCEFNTNSRGINQGDTKIEVSFDLICSHIEWN
ncbi:hypothetical protein [uncultured Dokdonia sp.]|uniref:hypothetical protein n=1 Tax=uncultured Dokdonia sp. TaxID=575653 RepID=UPI002627E287|nr:hypothetical protein [uncultured Dokdonia sp.]